jgi:L-threonylcarbamoyladenylate synthase
VAFTSGADALARRWWPGPLTLAFGFGTDLARPAWLDGRTEVAVRIPDDVFLRTVIEQTGALVVTSANPHGTPTPRTAQDVATSLGDDLELVVDGGELQDIPSTLVNVHALAPVVEREGAIARTAVESVLAEAR